MNVKDLPVVDVLGVRVHGPTLDQAVNILEHWIQARDGVTRTVTATGFHGIWVAHNDPHFRRILNASDLFCPDGIAPVFLSRLQGRPLPARVPGPDLMQAFLERSRTTGYRSYFYGDSEETLGALRREVAVRFSGAVVAGTCSPPFRALTSSEKQEHVDAINAARPDVLWLGLGCPKQDRWIAENRDRLKVPVVVGVGAAFRFLTGRVRRAPKLVQRSGFEWAWRLVAEPRKLWRRDLIEGPRFLAAALVDAYHVRKGAKA